MGRKITLRKLGPSDPVIISKAFKLQSWDKSIIQYQTYLEMQKNGERDILVAELEGEFAGYLTIVWKSNYIPFLERSIPEIVDLNVLKKFQQQGIASTLLDEAELRISKVSEYAGIGSGMYSDYGPAQILYIKRGYIPDGRGLVRDCAQLKYGDKITLDDSLAIYLSKKLS